VINVVFLSLSLSQTPCIVKIEELLFESRSRRSRMMRAYYVHWEGQLYCAVVAMVLRNLDVYMELLDQRYQTASTAAYSIKAVLQSNEVTLDPDAASIVEGSLAIVKGIIEGTKQFVRFYRCEQF
jgi:hypothetical protein